MAKKAAKKKTKQKVWIVYVPASNDEIEVFHGVFISRAAAKAKAWELFIQLVMLTDEFCTDNDIERPKQKEYLHPDGNAFANGDDAVYFTQSTMEG